MKIALCLLVLTLCGCTTRTLEFQGVKYTSRSFFTNPSIGPVRVVTSKEGVSELSMGSYSHNQTEISKLLLQVAAMTATP